MLVLLRRIGEEIQIGSAINVRVLTVSKHRVKLGVSGPGEVSVMRAEICEDVPSDTPEPPPTSRFRRRAR
jgi:carbon storage regulator CsrA